jgi:hypothetical protein
MIRSLVSPTIELARQQWEEGHRRLESQARDGLAYERLLEQVEAVTAELRRRVGQTFTLAELEAQYRGVERWGSEAVSENAAYPNWPRNLALVSDAAFHLYARGASDYRP